MPDEAVTRILHDLDGWLSADALVESPAEQRAVTRATLQRLRAVFEQQIEEIVRLREDQARARAETADLRTESLTIRSESTRLRTERNAAREESDQLRGALTSRVVIEQAKGMIAAHHGIGVDQAFQRLRKHARDHNARIHEIAAQVVSGEITL